MCMCNQSSSYLNESILEKTHVVKSNRRLFCSDLAQPPCLSTIIKSSPAYIVLHYNGKSRGLCPPKTVQLYIHRANGTFTWRLSVEELNEASMPRISPPLGRPFLDLRRPQNTLLSHVTSISNVGVT